MSASTTFGEELDKREAELDALFGDASADPTLIPTPVDTDHESQGGGMSASDTPAPADTNPVTPSASAGGFSDVQVVQLATMFEGFGDKLGDKIVGAIKDSSKKSAAAPAASGDEEPLDSRKRIKELDKQVKANKKAREKERESRDRLDAIAALKLAKLKAAEDDIQFVIDNNGELPAHLQDAAVPAPAGSPCRSGAPVTSGLTVDAFIAFLDDPRVQAKLGDVDPAALNGLLKRIDEHAEVLGSYGVGLDRLQEFAGGITATKVAGVKVVRMSKEYRRADLRHLAKPAPPTAPLPAVPISAT